MDSEDADHIVFQTIFKSGASRINVSFLINSVLFFSKVHIFDYPNPWLSRPFCLALDF